MSTGNAGEPTSRPLSDDSRFMDRLSALDDGVLDDRVIERRDDAPPPPTSRRPAPGAASRLSPPGPIPKAAVVMISPSLPPLVTLAGRRPLLDLFPLESALPRETEGTLRTTPLVALDAETPPVAAYAQFYGLDEHPFGPSTDQKFLYQSAAYVRVAQQMLGAIGRRDPVVLLAGPFGSGKTTVCRAVIEQLDRRTLTSFMSEPFDSIAELLKRLLIDFGVVAKDEVAAGRLATATREELANALRDFLLSLAPLEAFAVVIIDDADALAAGVVDELKKLVTGDIERLMQIVLVTEDGLQMATRRSSADARLATAPVHCALGPLERDEIAPYIWHRLRVAGRPKVEFTDAAFDRVLELSAGNPRLVNLLCDRALTASYADGVRTIEEGFVFEAAETLGLGASRKAGAGNAVMTAAVLAVAALTGAFAGVLIFHGQLAVLLARWTH